MDCVHCRKPPLPSGQNPPYKCLTDPLSSSVSTNLSEPRDSHNILEALLSLGLVSDPPPPHLHGAGLCGPCEELLAILTSAWRRFTCPPAFADSIIVPRNTASSRKCISQSSVQTQTDLETGPCLSLLGSIKVEVDDREFLTFEENGIHNTTDCVGKENEEGFVTMEKRNPLPETEKTQSKPVQRHRCLAVGCGKLFRSSYHLNRHQSVHSKNRNGMSPPFKCPTCAKCFRSRYHLARHTAVHTKDGAAAASGGDQKKRQSSNVERLVQDERIGGESRLRRRMRLAPNYEEMGVKSDDDDQLPAGIKWTKCRQAKRDPNLLPSKSQNKSKVEKKFVCSVDGCGRRFRDTRDLRVHSQTHLRPEDRPRPFPCPECGKAFRTAKAARIHAQLIHRNPTDQRDYLCTECGKAFKTASSLYTHCKSHGDRSAFRCRECGKGFNTNHLLQSHSRVHSDLRPFICDMCGVGFKSKLNLTKHMTCHSKEKAHLCPAPSCPSGFTFKYNLIQHMTATHRLERVKVKRYLNDPSSEQLFG